MSNKNDQPDIEPEEYLGLQPVPPMTREQFLAKLRNLADEMESNHEEQTGISDTELQDFNTWLEEIESAYHNS